MSLTIQYGAPITFVGSASHSQSVTLPTHVKDDVIVVFSYRTGSLTPPTAPDGWTTIATETHEDGGDECSARLAYRVAAGSGTVSGTWTNAAHTLFLIYRGVSISSPIVQYDTRVGAADSVRYDTLYDTLATSWAVTFAGHNAGDFDITSPYAGQGWVTRERFAYDPAGQAAGADSPAGGGVNFGLVHYHFGTETVWITARAELRASEGEREFTGYRMSPRARAFALHPQRAAGGGVRIIGDKLEDPSDLAVTVSVSAETGGLPAAYQLAYGIISEAERATLVTLHAGSFVVAGLTGYDLQPVVDTVDLTLRFAVAEA